MKTLYKAVALKKLVDEDWKTQLALRYPDIPKDAVVNVLTEDMHNWYGGPWTRVEWNGNQYWVSPSNLKKLEGSDVSNTHDCVYEFSAMCYNFNMKQNKFIDPAYAFACIEEHWHNWAANANVKTYVVGISGGVDSTCVAALACRIFGKDNVIGVSLPCDMQKDMQDVDEVFKHLGIKRITIDIGDAVHSLENSIENNAVELTEQCKINMPARIRMTTLFGVAQCFGGVVLNTCNRSESCVGFDTFFGDSCGCYAPIKNLTKTEVMELAMWLGVPSHLAFKTPVDGLQPLTDEQKFGFTYRELDMFIRAAGNISDITASKIKSMYHKNKFKLDIINVPGPKFEFLSDVFRAGLYV